MKDSGYEDDSDRMDMHQKFAQYLPWIRLTVQVLPLVAILFCMAWLFSQRAGLFPRNNRELPPVADTIVFPPQQPLLADSRSSTTDHTADTNVTQPADNTRSTSTPATGRTTPSTGSSSTTTSRTTPTTSSGTTRTTQRSTTTPSTTGSTTRTTTPGNPVARTGGTSTPTTRTPTKIDWKKTEINKPIPGAYVVIFLSRKVVAIVADGQYARAYYYASIPPTAKEGVYRIANQEMLGRVMAIKLNYPSAADAARALQAGTITRAQHDAIVKAHQEGKEPPYNTPLGGPVYIRDDGGNNLPARGMNFGISKKDMPELWIAVRRGSYVRVVK